jgi:uncharacterized RDD family membrane protein YckC
MRPTNQKIPVYPASPWKRLIAWVYDWLPAAGVLVLAFVIGSIAANLIFIDLPADQVAKNIRNHPLWIAYLVFGTWCYYGYCWHRGGQTIGYRTWRLKLIKEDGSMLTWLECVVRALLSFGGLANLWAFIDRDKRGWHDIAVDAYLVQLPKTEKSEEERKPLL